MAINYLNNIDLNKNEIQNVAIHVLATAPSNPVEGQIYYNSTDNKLFFFDGTNWIDASGDIKSVTTNTSNQISITDSSGPNPRVDIVTGAVTQSGTALATGAQIYSYVSGAISSAVSAISFTVSGTTNEVEVTNGSSVGNGDTVTIGLPDSVVITQDLNIAGGTILLDGVTGIVDIGAGSITLDGGTGNVTVGGDLTVNGTTTTVNSNTVTLDDPILTLGGDTAPTVDDNKDRGVEFRYHDGTSAKVGYFGYDDSTGKFTFIPDATNTSEVFTGTKGSIDVQNIDLAGSITSVDGSAPTAGQLLIGNGSNGDMELANLTAGEAITVTDGDGSVQIAVEDSSATNKGAVIVSGGTGITVSYSAGTATIDADAASETSAGIVELSTTAEALAGTSTTTAVTPAGLAARSWAGSIGNGAATSIQITHSLNTYDVIIQLYDTSTYETVYADVTRDGVNTATIAFANAPATGGIRVLATKVD